MQHRSPIGPRIILASESPRRRDLLEKAGLQVSVIPSNFDEHSVAVQDPPQYVRILAEEKAAAVAIRHPHSWVIGADTAVVIDGRILGKPKSHSEARMMLNRLNDRTHQVYTGYCICRRSSGYRFSETIGTDVRFKRLSTAEIEWYILTGEPFDKAGAYAIQGLGTFLVRRIDGSYTNVVGLPVCEVIDHLLEIGVIDLGVVETDGEQLRS